ncbi:hypothetical protein NPIL_299491 [Nephila pilipes]|uniref:Uncharacterized protein n=1 Tax=Nephila pilipes TaxID=299642 RepID=A0A8X6T6Z2_NEPPI|nr:hypothetical protein NPIL_299491 [Nephila pilipes]
MKLLKTPFPDHLSDVPCTSLTEDALISVLILESIPKRFKGNCSNLQLPLKHQSAVQWDIKVALIYQLSFNYTIRLRDVHCSTIFVRSKQLIKVVEQMAFKICTSVCRNIFGYTKSGNSFF